MRQRTFDAVLIVALAVTLSGSGCAVQTPRTGSGGPSRGVGDPPWGPQL
jgi:hypothetical protein